MNLQKYDIWNRTSLNEGFELKVTTHDKDNKEIKYYIRNYDVRKNETLFERYNSENFVIEKVVSEYNENGDILKKTFYDNGVNITTKEEYIYNPEGGLEVEKNYDGNNHMFVLKNYNYMNDGNLRISHYDKDGDTTYIYKEFYIYGQIFRSVSVLMEKYIITSHEYEYNEDRKETKVTCYKSIKEGENEILSYWENLYNVNEIVKTNHYDSENKTWRYINYENGKEVLIVNIDDGIEKKYKEFEYDEYGNLIKDINYDVDPLGSILIKEFEYFYYVLEIM